MAQPPLVNVHTHSVRFSYYHACVWLLHGEAPLFAQGGCPSAHFLFVPEKCECHVKKHEGQGVTVRDVATQHAHTIAQTCSEILILSVPCEKGAAVWHESRRVWQQCDSAVFAHQHCCQLLALQPPFIPAYGTAMCLRACLSDLTSSLYMQRNITVYHFPFEKSKCVAVFHGWEVNCTSCA